MSGRTAVATIPYTRSLQQMTVSASIGASSDLLMHYLLNAAPGSKLGAKHYIDRQIETLVAANALATRSE